jgi:glycosyltransferase involved in cell wall biosynthesis
MLSKKFNIPYVYNSHNVEYLRYKEFGRTSPLRYPFVPYMHYLEKTACQNAELTIAISSKDAKSFQAWVSPEKLIVVPAAFDESAYNPFYKEIPTERPVVLMVGNYRNFGNREGARLLAEKVVPAVVERSPDVIFRCVGKNFPEDITHPNIQSAGFVNDLMDEYRRAHLIVAPIVNGGGIKIKAIEALACGKPLISTSKGLEGIDPDGLENLYEASIEDFADCIHSALSRPQGHTEKNWERIRAGYSIGEGMRKILNHLDRIPQTVL